MPSNKKLYRGPIAWMASHHVAANLIMFLCIVGGFFYMQGVKQEVFPQFDLDLVTISVSYPGASPEEIESGILLAIENAVSSLDGIDALTSRATEGLGQVNIEMMNDVDPNRFIQDVQREVDRIVTFPDDAEKPKITLRSMKRKVLAVALYGNASTKSLHYYIEQLRTDLLMDDNISQVEVKGVPPLEISIAIDEYNLRRYNLTLEDIAQKLRSGSIDLPSGSIKTRGGEILIRMHERRDLGKEFGDITLLTSKDGNSIKLRDIAKINDGYEDNDYHALYNNQKAVKLFVFRVGKQTPIKVSQAVHQKLKEFEKHLPEGIHTAILSDRSKIFSQRVDLLLKNSGLGLILVLIFLALFLDIKLAFWVMMGLPISFLGSFLILPHLGVSINMISMFAYIIALGIVVDDAIIIGENIYHHRQQGMPALEAAITGAKEMASPITFSILTNIATFLPLAFMPGVMGKIFAVIPMVIVSVFTISLLESLFVLPGHLASMKQKDRHPFFHWIHSKQQKFSLGFIHFVDKVFMPVLRFALKHRYLTITLAFSILISTLSYAASGRMGFSMFPKVDSDFAKAKIKMPYGVHINKTNEVADYIYRMALKTAEGHPELIKGIYTSIGYRGAHNASVTVYLADPEVREKIMTTEEFTRQWRKQIGSVIGVESVVLESDSGGPGAGKALTLELIHNNLDVLQKASADLAEILQQYPNSKDVDDGFSPGKQQLDFSVNETGHSLGFTAQSIANQVRHAYQGLEVLRQLRERNEIKVKLRLPKTERESEFRLEEFILKTPQGKEVPLREVVNIERGHAFTEINRRNNHRVVRVSAAVVPRSKATEIVLDLKSEILPKLQQKYPGLRYSFEGSQAEIRKSMGSLIPLFALAIILIYAMLAIPFQSYSQPLIVLVSIPFGIIGAIFGHIIMGYSLSIVSMLGIVALSGIVVNDSLVLIDYANQLKRKNRLKSAIEIMTQAARQRFRPILLTTITTFGGLFPMILETSRQAKFLIPMAVSIAFGLIFATMITLLLIPSLYLAFEDIKNKFNKETKV